MKIDHEPGNGDEFVNPYTFVPFVDPSKWEPWRCAPAGHDRIGNGRFSGRVDVELTARSSLLVRGVTAERAGGEDENGPYLRFPRRVDGVPFVPGSSLAGTFRSLHESVAGGCLRVFDGAYRPGYRDTATVRTGYWYLARVDEVDRDGRPTNVTICPETVWVPAKYLARQEALGSVDNVRTGATVQLLSRRRRFEFGTARGRKATREQITNSADVVAGDGWVVLLTDGTVRKRDGVYFAAAGRLAAAPRPVAWANGDSDGADAWGDYLAAVDGTDDMRRARMDSGSAPHEAKPTWLEVRPYAGSPDVVGYRMAARRRLFASQVVWLRLRDRFEPDGNPAHPVHVEQISLAQIWRHSGGWDTAADRLPKPELLACQDIEQLCPTCRVFGSAETAGSDTDAATQKSYRGHLRFSDAVLDPGTGSPEVYALPPMSAPRPGVGQFYLRHDAKKLKQPIPLDTPQREWGSALDAINSRKLRGRKHYWLTGNPARRPFFRAVKDNPQAFEELYAQPNGKKNALLTRAEAMPAGSVFRFTLHFENLSPVELGGVLASLAPQDIVTPPHGDAEIGFAVGAGKPFGFGTCTSRVSDFAAYSARTRYTSSRTDALTIGEALTAFRAAMPKEEAKRIWRALGHALTLDRVEPHAVWYPPAGPLPADGPLNPRHLRPSFRFWTSTRGYVYEGRGREPDELTLLPVLGGQERQTLYVERDQKQISRGTAQ